MDDLLEQLALINPRLRGIVEMRVFEGMQVAEISQKLGIVERTGARNWVFCKQWLRDRLSLRGSCQNRLASGISTRPATPPRATERFKTALWAFSSQNSQATTTRRK
jgi:ECF sigma factor